VRLQYPSNSAAAEPRVSSSRLASWAAWALSARMMIGVLTIIEGINDGFTFLNWVVIAMSVVFALQAVWTLGRDRSSQA
jgi:hypothetical protein